MKLGKKQLGVLICLFAIILVTLVVFLITNYSFGAADESLKSPDQPRLNSEIYTDLTSRQLENGSWSDDLETTVIASNALSQSVDLMNEHEKEIEWDTDGDGVEELKIENEKSIDAAENWTVDNYQQDAPIVTQSMVNYNGISLFRIIDVSEDLIIITQQTSDIILSSQSPNGSWNGDIKDTSFSLYVLKKNPEVNVAAITNGEKWLISQHKGGSWGSTLNDTLVLLALHNSTYEIDYLASQLITRQSPDGSFGDLETTAWAVIALSSYDVPGSSEAAENARQWLLEQRNLSDREVALISLAESEYITMEVSKLSCINGVQTGKGPPLLFLIIIGIIGGTIIILSIILIRLSERDALSGARKDIYEYVKAHPGVSQNALMRRMALSSSSIRHHLRILQNYDYILPHTDGKYIRYYVNRNGYSIYTNGNSYKDVISVLRKNTAANIVKYLMENPNSTQRKLAKALKLHPSTIHWHTNLLIESNIISAERAGKTVQYQINGPIDIDKLLVLAN